MEPARCVSNRIPPDTPTSDLEVRRTDEQDLTAQRDGLAALGVETKRIYIDHGLTGRNADLIRARTREGMKVAKSKGRLRGKSPSLHVYDL